MGFGRIVTGLLTAGWLLAAPLALQAQDNKAVDDLMRQAQSAMQKGQPREAESTLRKALDLEAFTATRVTIDTGRSRIAVATDGEVSVMDTPLEYENRPGALQVIVAPRAAGGSAP